MPFNRNPWLHRTLVAVLLLIAVVLVASSAGTVTASPDRALMHDAQVLLIPPGGMATAQPPSGTLPAPPASVAAGGVVYLTFDDGPHPRWTPQILTVLARYRAHATFFVIGQQAQGYPGLIDAIVNAGHTIGNHTFSHASLRGVGRERFVNEVQRTQAVLGRAGTACLRPPYGAMDAATRGYAAELGYRIVRWDIDPRDWALRDAAPVASHVLQRVRPGSIVLLHDGGGPRAHTVAALDTILRQLSARGYRFAPVCR